MTCGLVGLLRAESSSLPYHSIHFEENEGYQAGKLHRSGIGLQLLQGDARIAREDGDESGQYLETLAGVPYASTHFSAERISRDDKTYYEIWVRPSASPIAKSEEFMDIDGAILGFFSDGPDRPATFHAYHRLPGHEGYWVSTGVSAAVGPSGMTQDWIRIGICQNIASGTWNLEIGGELVLSEIRYSNIPLKNEIQLWLLGHETSVNRFDDLIISPVAPDSLRLGSTKEPSKNWSARNGYPTKLDRTEERKIGRKQSEEDRRRHDASNSPDVPKIPIIRFDVKFDIIEGATPLFTGNLKDSDSRERFTLITVLYDNDGNPMPMKVKIQCDAELSEGLDLSKMLWVVSAKVKIADQEVRRVITKGNFATGFIQIAEIPSEWVNKGITIHVGTHIILKPFP